MDEEAATAEQVGEPPSQQEHAAEEDCVGGDHPLQVRLGKVKIGLDRGERDVHDRHIEDDHELGRDDQGEGAPAPALSFGSDRGECHL